MKPKKTYSEIKKRAEELAKLEKTAPYGRCVLCNLVLEKSDIEQKLYPNMHQNCKNNHYGD